MLVIGLALAVGVGVWFLAMGADSCVTLRGKVDGYAGDRLVVRSGERKYYIRLRVISGRLETGQDVVLRIPATMIEVQAPSVSDKTLLRPAA